MSNTSASSVSSNSSDYESEEEQPNLKGKLVNKKYVGISELGNGSYSKVWLIYCPVENNFFALKIQNYADTKEAAKEISFFEDMGKRECKNVINIKEKFWHQSEFGRHMCMVFPLMGYSLYDFCKSYLKSNKCFQFEHIMNIFKEITLSIKEIHKIGIIHTDLKTENILTSKIDDTIISKIKTIMNLKLNEKYVEKQKSSNKKNNSISNLKRIGKIIKNDIESDNESDYYTDVTVTDIEKSKYLLCDFGSAQYSNNIKTNKIQTRYYRSPESILDAPINNNSDMWSLGCIFYEVLTGDTLFKTNKKENKITENLTDDQYHFYQMYSYFGKLPENLIDSAKKKDKFFNKDYTFNFIDESTIENKKLSSTFASHYSKNNVIELLNIIVRTLRYDNNKRISSEELYNLFD
jgi:serine/threonine protein kinase